MKYVGFAVALVILAFLVMDFNSRTAELNRLTSEHAVVKAEQVEKKATKAALEKEIAYATSDAAVYEWAYQNHMVRAGDMPVVPVGGAQITPTPTPRPTVESPKSNHLDRWLLLFIDPH